MLFIKTWNLVPVGLRGIMGVGTNRMNKYTVGMATQGYGNYLKQSFPNEQVKSGNCSRQQKQQPVFC